VTQNEKQSIRVGEDRKISVSLTDGPTAQVEVYTAGGVLIRRALLNADGVIDLSSAPRGTFIVRVRCDGKTFSKVIVI